MGVPKIGTENWNSQPRLVSHVALKWKMAIHPSCAIFGRQITKQDSLGGICSSSLQRGMTPAPKGCTSWFSHSTELLMVWGGDFIVSVQIKNLLSTTSCSLDPSTLKTLTYVDDDTATIATSNWTNCLSAQTSMAAMARGLFGNPMPQYLNALTIAANQVIADTGATSIFIMEGVNVDNKCIAL
jgi:hypothetical protein